MSRIVVSPLDLDSVSFEDYARVFLTCGFEQRSSYLVTQHSFRPEAVRCHGFLDRFEWSFYANRLKYESLAIEPSLVSDWDFEVHFRTELTELVSAGGGSVAVDISSLSRRRLASVISSWFEIAKGANISLDLFYVVARAAPANPEVPLVFHGIVHPSLAGWSSHPERPVLGIVSAGYEQEKVMASLERLEVNESIVYRTSVRNIDYFNMVTEANHALWSRPGVERVIHYDISRPADLFINLETQMFYFSKNYRIVIFPYGPKIFAAVSMLVALEYRSDISVWNCSGGPIERTSDRIASGEVVAFRVTLGHELL